MKRLAVFFVLFVILSFNSIATIGDNVGKEWHCKIDLSSAVISGYSKVGLVSTDGHFTGNTGALYPYALFCPAVWSLTMGEPTFYYAPYLPPTYNGSGHVSNNTDFSGLIELGFGSNSCSIKSSCENNESCIFKVSDSDNGHIADCAVDNHPMTNTFNDYLCCQLKEVCDDGIDNDGNGLIDCADEACWAYPGLSIPPGECTGNNQTTEYCINNPGECNSQFCSYGLLDNPSLQPQGFCCPKGAYSERNIITGEWSCQQSEQCGIDSSRDCNFDFSSSLSSWVGSYYQGDPDDWCVSRVPWLYAPPALGTVDQSAACCLIPRHGDTDYYVVEGNVRVFGVSPACGDGDVNGVEECDGNNLDGKTCADILICPENYSPAGTPSCTNTCSLSVGSCYCKPGFTGGGTYGEE